MPRSIRYIFVISMLGSIVFQLSHKMVYATYFMLNRSNIIEQHCVNKNRPELMCNGRCHLKKYLLRQTKLNKVKNQSEKGFDWTITEKLPIQFLQKIPEFDISYYLFFCIIEQKLVLLPTLQSRVHCSRVLRPPTCNFI